MSKPDLSVSEERFIYGNKTSSLVIAVLLIALAVTGILIAIYNTRFGPILNGDSVVYMQGASNLLDGNGYSTLLGRGEVEPIKGFPPFTSISLAIANLGRADMVQTGRWANAILFGLSILLAGFLVFRYSRSILAAFIAAALITVQQAMVFVFSSVMSEGLFIFLLLLSIWTVTEYFWSGKIKWLITSGILTALCFLTRYVGLVLIPVIGVGLLFFGKQNWKKRLFAILIFGIISAIPVILWFVRNQIVSGSAIDRQIGLHLMSQNMRGLISDNILSWLYITMFGLPWRIEVLIFGILLVALFVWFGIALFKSKEKWKENHSGGYQLPVMLVILFFTYIFAIWANTSMLDATTSQGAIGRYLSPLFVCMVVMLACITSVIAQQQKGILLKIFFSVIGFLLIGYYSSNLLTYLNNSNSGMRLGYGYTDNINYWTDEVALLKQLDPDRPIITNDPQLLYALSNRFSYSLPLIELAASSGSPLLDDSKLFSELSQGDYLVIIVRGDKEVSDFIPEIITDKLTLYKNTFYVWVYLLTDLSH